jgi:hypothetical protein
MSTASDLGPEGPKGRSKLMHISGPAIGVAGVAFINWVGGVPSAAAVSILAVLVGFLAIAYSVRTEIHLEHLIRTRSTRPLHIVVVVLEIVVSLAFLAAPVVLLSEPDRLTELLYALALALLVVSLGLAMSRVSKRYGIKTGTQLASHCWFVRGLRWLISCFDHFRLFAWLNSLWERHAPAGNVSYLVVWITAALIAVAAANGPPLIKHLGNGPRSKKTGRKSGGSGHETEPTSRPSVSDQPSNEEGDDESEPSLTDLCGNLSHPGEPAPEPAYAHLYAQWLGLGIGLGGITAGCPQPAHLLANGLWYEAGTCHGAFRALAVAAPGVETGAILLWRPARFALSTAENGTLKSATSSRLADEGEFYTVTTASGTNVFIREHVSNGNGGLKGKARDCGDIEEDPVPFVKLPPALSRLWFEQVLSEEVWIWPATEAVTSTGTEFTFNSTDPADTREITATCMNHTYCELVIDGASVAASGPEPIDVGSLLEVAPPKPASTS